MTEYTKQCCGLVKQNVTMLIKKKREHMDYHRNGYETAHRMAGSDDKIVLPVTMVTRSD